jgi:hypothetical protein
VVSRHVISAVRRGWSQDKWKNERTEKDSDVRKLDKNLRQELLAMLAEDLSVREELADDGSVGDCERPSPCALAPCESTDAGNATILGQRNDECLRIPNICVIIQEWKVTHSQIS